MKEFRRSFCALMLALGAAMLSACCCQITDATPVVGRKTTSAEKSASAASKDTPVVPFRFVSTYDKATGLNRITIIQNGEVKLVFDAVHEGGVMENIEAPGCAPGYHRMAFEKINENTDYRKCLWDATGNGDRRYITLAEWYGGNDAFNFKGYLIDVKDDFRVLGEIPVGECPDYPNKNPDLIFPFSCEIEYFGAEGYASVVVNLKLNPGKFPELIYPKKTGDDPWEHEKISPNLTARQRRMAFIRMCCNLVSNGRFASIKEVARQKGFTEKEISDNYPGVAESFNQCGISKYLYRINGVECFY